MTLACGSCGASIEWTVIPGNCPACGVAVHLKGATSGCDFMIQQGKIVEVLWYEWDQDLQEAIRADLKTFDESIPEGGVYDLTDIVSQGNGHFGAGVEVVAGAIRAEREAARAASAARTASLLPIAIELVAQMWGRPARHVHPEDRVDCIHPQKGGTVDRAFMVEYRRCACLTRAWLETLLGEPVQAKAPILDVAERWLMWGRPETAPCDWTSTVVPELSARHRWVVEENDDGIMGVNDYWRCDGCTASGGPAWFYEDKDIAGKVIYRLPPGFHAFCYGLGDVGDDCVEAKRKIDAFKAAPPPAVGG